MERLSSSDRQRSGLSRKAIRLYEARGLLQPIDRLDNGYRRYSEHDVQLLRFIRHARSIGLGLVEIGMIIQLRRTGTPPSADVLALLRARLDVIQQAISELGSLQETLEAVAETAAAAAGQGHDVLLCDILRQSGSRPHPPGDAIARWSQALFDAAPAETLRIGPARSVG